MTVLCCGDREWTDMDRITRELKTLDPGTVIVHGAARGADTLCGMVAELLGYDVKPYPADWALYGKAAGPVRNRAMLRMHPEIQLVLAFHDRIHASKGTRDMIHAALAVGVVVRLVAIGATTTIFPPQPKLI